MKILLINPSQGLTYGDLKALSYAPLGIAYIAAVLEKAGYEVEIIDIEADNINDESLIEMLKKNNYDIVGLTATSPTYQNAEKVCKLVKENSNAKTILGGVHASIMPEECIKSKYIDFLIRGEGEETILDFIETFLNKKDFTNVLGLSFKKMEKIFHNKPRPLIKDINTIPFPSRHLFKNQNYSYPDSLEKTVMPIFTSRGCPNKCTYCCSKPIFSNIVRLRSAENIIDEIEFLIKNYKVKEIHIWDDTFSINKKRVLDIAKQMKERNIKVKISCVSGLRVDMVDREILQALKDMGAYSTAFGVESGVQEILDNVKKGTTIKKIEEAFSLAKKMGFETWAFFMLGLPGETPDTIKQTINFAKKIDPDIAKFHILKPFPGTEIFNEFKAQNLIIDFDYSHYGIHTDPVHKLDLLSPLDLIKWSKIAYRKFYFRPIKIFKHILRIRSFERLKSNFKTGLMLLNFIRKKRK